MAFCYLNGQQISVDCANRWEKMGWIELVQVTGREYHYQTTRKWRNDTDD